MQIGKAFYCDGCGVNIYSGSQCSECDPASGSKQVVITFIVPVTMTGLENLDPNVKRQYEGVWGPYATTGDYGIGDIVGDIVSSGEILWRYQSDKGLVYVIDDHGWPAEVLGSSIIVRQ